MYRLLDAVDLPILQALNHLAGTWWLLDRVLLFVVESHLLKGGVFMMGIWWLWFTPRPDQAQVQRQIIVMGYAAVVAMALARFLAVALPHRPRPLYNPSFQLAPLPGRETTDYLSSAFPSDHATLFFCLVAGIWLISRPAGIAAMVYAAVVIAFPRLYLALHHPSDIVLGGCLGAVVMLVLSRASTAAWLARYPERWLAAHPASFYAVFFLFSYQIAELFDGSRALASFLWDLARVFVHRLAGA